MTGTFISFEGIDGSGKSTQARLLARRLEARGHSTLLTREPGGSTGAEEIRSLLVEGAPGRWSPETELLLFNAARRDHLERTIWPALEAGKVAITDRFADSTRVYQGATRGDLRAMVDQMHRLIIGQEPDLTLILDMDPEIALDRGLARSSGEDRFEEFGLSFQRKLRDGFLALAQEVAPRAVVMDATGSEEQIADQIEALVVERLDPVRAHD